MNHSAAMFLITLRRPGTQDLSRTGPVGQNAVCCAITQIVLGCPGTVSPVEGGHSPSMRLILYNLNKTVAPFRKAHAMLGSVNPGPQMLEGEDYGHEYPPVLRFHDSPRSRDRTT